jgi:hypothetical protein
MKSQRLTQYLAIAAVLVVLYAISAYISLFSHRLAYAYHPETDRLYKISLVQDLAFCDKLTPLIPFKSCSFSEVGDVEYKGKVKAGIEERAADDALLITDPDKWVEKSNARIKAIGAFDDHEFYSLAYFAHGETPSLPMIPEHLAKLKVFAVSTPVDVFVADVALSRSRLKANKPEVEVISSAIIVKGNAVNAIPDIGL